VLFGIRFLEDPRPVEFLERVQMAVTGHDDERQCGPPRMNRSGELDAVHRRHGKVGENHVDLDSACDQPERLLAALGRYG
jgi:hypothetical protein